MFPTIARNTLIFYLLSSGRVLNLLLFVYLREMYKNNVPLVKINKTIVIACGIIMYY